MSREFKLAERPCWICKKMDARWIDQTYRLVRFDPRGLVAHPWCLIKLHGEEKARELVPQEEWSKRALA